MVGNGGTGTAAGWLPDAGVRQVFVPGGPRPLIVGVPRAAGRGRPVPGGYVVSGRWGFASGIAHADWLIAGFSVAEAATPALVAVVPARDVEVAGSWRVAGLQGTGLMQRQLRNALGARQHIGVSEQFYETAGRLRIQRRLPRPKAVTGAVVAVHSRLRAALTRPGAYRNSAHIRAQTGRHTG